LCERFDRHKWNAQCSSAEMDTLTDIHTLHYIYIYMYIYIFIYI
jgi:hypothetical protein